MEKKPLTLTGLLIIVATMAFVASVIVVTLSAVQGNVRDAQRMEDIRTITEALESYRSLMGTYPIATATTTLAATSTAGSMLMSAGSLSKMPKDPTLPQYRYVSDPVGSTYSLSFCLETASMKDFAQGCDNVARP